MVLVRRVMFISTFLVWQSSSIAAANLSITRTRPPSLSVRNREEVTPDRPLDITRLPDNIHKRGGNIQKISHDETFKVSLSPLALMSMFAFLGGWSHTLCNKKFDCYTSLLSGHILNMSSFLAEKKWNEALWHLSIIGGYFGGAASARSIELKCDDGGAAGAATTRHFRVLAPLVVVVFAIAEEWERVQVNLLAFGFGLVYPSVITALGGTVVHLLTGHTTNVARLVGARDVRHRGMKTSLCVIGSVVSGAIFGTRLLGVLGDQFPYFMMLGFLYAAALLLLLD